MIDELGEAPSVARVRELSEAIRLASLCGLGQAAPLALLAALDEFAADFGLSAASRPVRTSGHSARTIE